MPETVNHQFVYFDKTRLPFKPDTRQIIYFDISPYSEKMDYVLTKYIYHRYNDFRIQFASLGYDFIFLPRISKLLDSEELYRYFKPDATVEELYNFHYSIPYNHDSRDIERLVEYLMNINPREIEHFRTGLICYAGPEYDTSSAYAFFYMPFPRKHRYIDYDDLPSIAEFFRKYVHELGDAQMHDDYRKEDVSEQLHDADILIDERCCCRSIGVDEESVNKRERVDINRIKKESVALKETWADQNFSTDVTGMLSDVKALILELRQRGVSQWILDDIIKSPRTLSRLHIKGTRIFLTDYNNMEITMGPLPKAVFLLFLRHPEGIRFACLPDYREELYKIYSMLTAEENVMKIRQSVEDVTDPTRNSINENASRIRRAFVDKIDPELAKHYFITGERGEEKKITLSRDLVDWDTFLLSQ